MMDVQVADVYIDIIIPYLWVDRPIILGEFYGVE